MILGEPNETPYDWRFRLFGFPVRVHPIFWLGATFLGADHSPRGLLIWIPVVLVSLLVHELGHAFMIRYYGAASRIVLYAFGGLAITEDRMGPIPRTPPQQAIISLAGPVAGFLFAGLVAVILWGFGRYVPYSILGWTATFGRGEMLSPGPSNLQWVIWWFVFDLLFVNIYWGLFNLLPIYPLDGGQISRQMFVVNSDDGIRDSLQLSLGVAAVLVGLSLIGEQYFCALMMGGLAYGNYQELQARGFSDRSW